MSALVDRITDALRQDGWTCEYHEPVSGPGECSQCDDAHCRTAEQIAALFTEECGYQIEGDQPDEPDAWFPAADYRTSRPVTHRRWVSSWITEQEQP